MVLPEEFASCDKAQLLLNLSVLMDRPTGISIYAQSILPYLESLAPMVLSVAQIGKFQHHEIPDGLSSDSGSIGHLRRLYWLQRKLPKICRQLEKAKSGTVSSLIFSPVPEAPLFCGCRSVVMVHDTIPLRFPAVFPRTLVGYFQYYVKQVVAQAEHVLCNSVATARDVATFYQVPASKVTPVLLAHDSQSFRPCATEVGNYFLYVGRHNPHKNLNRLIAAFAGVCKTDTEVMLWVVGPQDERYTPGLMAQVRELGLTGRVQFLDYVKRSHLPIILSNAIALTFPSLWEGFGFPVLEAMACGTPVITSNISSLPEVAGDAALLVDPYNVDELSSAMRRVLQEPALAQQLSQAGLARARAFSWQRTGQQTVSVLKRFL